jgi:hypothetical protein
VSKYLAEISKAIEATHGCKAAHVATEHVNEVFRAEVAWDGDVEIFEVSHPKAKRCYAWGYEITKGDWAVISVLGIPPVVSAETAVKVAIAAQAKR